LEEIMRLIALFSFGILFLLTAPASAQFLGGCYEQCKSGDNSAACYEHCGCVAEKIFQLPRDQQIATYVAPFAPQSRAVLEKFSAQCVGEQLDSAARERRAAAIDMKLGDVACRSPSPTVATGAKTFPLDVGALKRVLHPLSANNVSRYGLHSGEGASVKSAIPGFGLVAGTIVLSVDGQRVSNPAMLLSYVDAKPEGSDVTMCVLSEGPTGRAARESNLKFQVLHEGTAGPLVNWLTAPGVWSTSCEQPGIVFKRKNSQTLERLYSTGEYPPSLTEYSSRGEDNLTVQYRIGAALEIVEIERVDEMTQKSTVTSTYGAKFLTKVKTRCPCDRVAATVQEFCKRPH
jgi:hypothetical protein